MATWSSRRKTRYALGVFLALIIFIGIPVFFFVYEKPTCFDGKQNGDELNIDCGGSCTRLCQSAFLPPRIEWGGAKVEKLTDTLYNVSAYIVNPNVFGAANDVPYKMSLYDINGELIAEREGKVTLYPQRNSLAFQSGVNTQNKIPTKATFEFIKSPNWFKSEDMLSNISVVEKKYEEDEEGSSLTVTLENRGLTEYYNITVSAILYDEDGNVVGFSQTRVDRILPKNGRETAPFTWPISRNGKVVAQDIVFSTKPLPSNN